MSPDSPPWEASLGQMMPIEIGNDRIILDEVAVRGRRLPVVEDLGGHELPNGLHAGDATTSRRRTTPA